jgi:hypothetical protein
LEKINHRQTDWHACPQVEVLQCSVVSRLASYQILSDSVKGLWPKANIAALDELHREIADLIVLAELRVAGGIGSLSKKKARL